MSLKRILFFGLILALGITLGFYLHESKEEKVKKQFQFIAKWVSKENAEEDSFVTAERIQNLSTLFANSFSFKGAHSSLSGTYSPVEIATSIALKRRSFSEIQLNFQDIEVEFPDSESAVVHTTAKLTGSSTCYEKCGSQTTETLNESYTLLFSLKLVEGKYLLDDAQIEQ